MYHVKSKNVCANIWGFDKWAEYIRDEALGIVSQFEDRNNIMTAKETDRQFSFRPFAYILSNLSWNEDEHFKQMS